MNNKSLFEEGAIRLTALDPEKDAEVLSGWTQSPSFVKHHFRGIFRPYMVSEVKKKMKETLKKAGERNLEFYFAVREVESGKIVGLVKFGCISGSNQVSWMYIDMVDEAAFSTHAKIVLQMALRYAFMELSLHRVGVDIPAYKEEEITLYEEAGFLRESQRRQAEFYNGKYYDQMVYAMLRSEWKKQQERAS